MQDSKKSNIHAIIGVLFIAVAMIAAKDAFAQNDEECPEAPPGFQMAKPSFRPVNGDEYCYLNDLLKRGYALTQWNLGVRYDDWGKHAEAFKWFRAAAEQGDAPAQYKVGTTYADGRIVSKDAAEAAKWYRLAAEQGHVNAQIRLGYLYRVGRGVPRDYAEAMKLFRLVAEKGNDWARRSALYSLGIMYGNGEGVPQDYVEAMKWYLLAAERGSGEAMLELSSMYRNGRGVPRDNVTAYMWFTIYAADVYVEAPNSRETAEKDMTPADISKGQALAHEWLEAQRQDD